MVEEGYEHLAWAGPAMVHRRIAMHLIDEAAGVWDDEHGVIFRTYEQVCSPVCHVMVC